MNHKALSTMLIVLCLPMNPGRSAAAPTISPVVPHPSAHLSSSDSYDEGSRLQKLGRHFESIAYFQRAVDEFPSAWNFRRDLATALHNASLEMRNDFGYVEYRVPLSLERARLGMRAIRELQVAEQLAQHSVMREDARALRYQILQVWGF